MPRDARKSISRAWHAAKTAEGRQRRYLTEFCVYLVLIEPLLSPYVRQRTKRIARQAYYFDLTAVAAVALPLHKE
jgi:hypothetical protein